MTDTRYFSEKLSRKYNVGKPPYTDPTACHWCRDPFRPGQIRFPILDEVNFGDGWGVVSICMDCFKNSDGAGLESAISADRFKRTCNGCGEPMLTPTGGRFRFQVCSNRCYQRFYRRRRRGQDSAIEWKAAMRQCASCRQDMTGKRKGAKYCSAACRQRAYRGRT